MKTCLKICMTGCTSIFFLLTRTDKIILIACLFASLASFGVRNWLQQEGTDAVVEVNGRLYARVSLLQPDRIRVTGMQGEVCIQVEDGALRVVSSTCRNKICMQRGWIRHAGDMIVCAPNRVIIRILPTSGHPFDMITG
ncbi:NusG domain II-containing protein [candidate division KSB1 bacterium]|nr:NusG domain II-containing protein [candidate division KSB1 bacterium]